MLGFDERVKNLTETIGDPEENERIRQYINANYWKFAKTYAEFCPHEYTLRQYWRDKASYNALVHHIWKYGVDGYYGTKTVPNRYWFDHEGGYYYFIYQEDTDEEGNPTDQAYLINRAKIEDFPFWIEDKGEGKIVRCNYGFGRKVQMQRATTPPPIE